MRLAKWTFLSLALVSIGLFVTLRLDIQESKATFGISPSSVKNDHMLPGTTYEQVMTLIRTDIGSDARVKIRLENKPASKWVKIEDEKNLIIKRGEKTIQMKVIVKVPKRAEMQRYRTGIFVAFENIITESGGGGGGAGAGVVLGGHILVDITVVGDKVIDYVINYVKAPHWTAGESYPLDVFVKNFGNTSIERLNGQIDIYDYKETKILKSLTFGQLTQKVRPDEKIASQIVFDDLGLEPGRYWIKVKVFKDGSVIYNTRFSQKVLESVTPILIAEDETRKPSIPKTMGEGGALSPEEFPEAALRPAASAVAATPVYPVASPETKLYVIFGLVGFGFGMIVLVAVIVLLVVLLKRQHEATIQHYFAHSHYKKHEK